MESLNFEGEGRYDGLKTAIHLAQYAVVRELCFGKSVLDLACGDGYGSWHMMDWGADEVVGIDASAEAIKRASDSFVMKSLEFQVADTRRLLDIFGEKRFDLIVLLETAEQVENFAKLLSDSKKLLKPNGVLIVSCPNDVGYHPVGQIAEPHRMRKYTLAQLREIAHDAIGAPRAWYLGTPQAGFVNLRVDGIQKADGNCTRPLMPKAFRADSAIAVPSEHYMGPTESGASYLLGIWSDSQDLSLPPSLGAALAPLSKDAFSSALLPQTIDETHRPRAASVQTSGPLERVDTGDTMQSNNTPATQLGKPAPGGAGIKINESFPPGERDTFEPGPVDAPQARERAIEIEKDVIAAHLADLTHRERQNAQHRTRLQQRLMAATLEARRAKASEAISRQQMLEQQGRMTEANLQYQALMFETNSKHEALIFETNSLHEALKIETNSKHEAFAFETNTLYEASIIEADRQRRALIAQIETLSFEAHRYRRIRDALPKTVRRIGMKLLRAAKIVAKK